MFLFCIIWHSGASPYAICYVAELTKTSHYRASHLENSLKCAFRVDNIRFMFRLFVNIRLEFCTLSINLASVPDKTEAYG